MLLRIFQPAPDFRCRGFSWRWRDLRAHALRRFRRGHRSHSCPYLFDGHDLDDPYVAFPELHEHPDSKEKRDDAECWHKPTPLLPRVMIRRGLRRVMISCFTRRHLLYRLGHRRSNPEYNRYAKCGKDKECWIVQGVAQVFVEDP